MDALFLKIINMSIAASWLILAVILLRLVLKKAPKWINVLLWALVAVRLIFPVSFESSLSLIPNAEPISQEIINNIIPEYEFETFTDAEANRFAQAQHQPGDVLVTVSHSLDGKPLRLMPKPRKESCRLNMSRSQAHSFLLLLKPSTIFWKNICPSMV